MIKRAIIYCRVSTTKQANDWDSLNNQEKACRNYCDNKNIKVLAVYQEAFTWKSSNRPKFDEAKNYAKVNHIDYFVIFDIDRFSREWFWAYSKLKQELTDNWIQLLDSKSIIGETTIIHKNELIDMNQYKWNSENNSEITEAFFATQAYSEWKKILQRTIPREIQLEQMGYKVREANFWYINKKINSHLLNGKKATIQIEHPIEWPWIKEIFLKRSEWCYTDEEIVDVLNAKWFLTRRNKKLTTKKLQVIIQYPIYAWIVLWKWTGNKAVLAPYKWLVSIETWNKANKWKISIIQTESDEIHINYGNDSNLRINMPIKKVRKSYNPDFCFSRVFKCPICWGYLTWSSSRGQNWKQHHYYFCKWKGKESNTHTAYSIRRDEVHEAVYNSFKNIKISDSFYKVFEEVSIKVYEKRKNEVEKEFEQFKSRKKELEIKEQEIINSIDKLINYPQLLDIKNKELENIKNEQKNLSLHSERNKKDLSLWKYLYYSKQLLKHIEELLKQKERPELIQLVFDIYYGWSIVYEDIISQTPDIPEFSSILKQKKSSNDENFSKNHIWQAH